MMLSLVKNHLSSLISIIRNTPPDLIIISKDGAEIMTWKLLLGLFSRTVSELLQNDDHKNDLAAISLPVERKIIETMMDILENSKEYEVKDNEAAVLLGITVANVNVKIVTTNISSIFMEDFEDRHNVNGSIETVVSATEEFTAKTDEKLAD